jgi:F0F1-type ATP synthase membrane subunit a
MTYFVVIGIAVIIVVALLASYLMKKNPSKKHYILPGTVLTVISFVFAIVSFFTEGGWNAIGYEILFVFVAIASLIGTIIGKSFGKRPAEY